MRLLVVDDDPSTLFVLSRLLRSEGHEVDTAASGAAAMDRIRTVEYDALLTDLVMPGMSGLDLIQKAGALRDGLLCIVITGQPPPEPDLRGSAIWLQKPLDFDAVLAVLERVRGPLPRTEEGEA